METPRNLLVDFQRSNTKCSVRNSPRCAMPATNGSECRGIAASTHQLGPRCEIAYNTQGLREGRSLDCAVRKGRCSYNRGTTVCNVGPHEGRVAATLNLPVSLLR